MYHHPSNDNIDEEQLSLSLPSRTNVEPIPQVNHHHTCAVHVHYVSAYVQMGGIVFIFIIIIIGCIEEVYSVCKGEGSSQY